MLSSHYIKPLTGLRAVAAFWVLLFHLSPQILAIWQNTAWFAPLVLQGYLAVDLFFVLSGFIIAHHYAASWRRGDYVIFIWRRLARLYPAHLVTLLSVAFMVFMAQELGYSINNPTDYTFKSFVANIFLVHAWSFPTVMTWNHVSWSISAEFLAYLLTPVFFWLTAHKNRSLKTNALLLFLFLAITPLIVFLMPFSSNAAYAIFRVLGGFGAGVVINQFYRNKIGHTLKWSLLIYLTVLMIVLASVLTYSLPSYLSFLVVPLFGLLIYGVSQDINNHFMNLLNHRFFQYWGCVSYSLYMVQFLVIMPLRKFIPINIFSKYMLLHQCGVLFIEIAVILILSMMTYHIAEKPMRQFLYAFFKE